MQRRLGEFEIGEKIADGGMASVYRGVQRSLQRDVAVKFLHPHFADNPDFVRRFIREARCAASLQHPNIVQIYSVGCDGSIPYIIMEYVRGQTLHQYLRSKIHLELGDAIDILIKTADALACAAERGIVHRDIKPDNIMVMSEGRVKVMDFGLAKAFGPSEVEITRAGKVLGTARYMSPEQSLGHELDSRSDIYSLGVVFFELLAGRAPFVDENPTAVILMHLNEPLPPVTYYNRRVPPRVEAFLERLMSKEPARRPQTMQELIGELENLRQEFELKPQRPDRMSEIHDLPTGSFSIETTTVAGPRCLIVEDDAEVSRFYAAVLNDMNVDTLIARNGMEGLTLWRQWKPDLVLLDLSLGDIGGLALLEERRNSGLKGTVLVTSSSNDWPTIQRTAEHGIAGYLMKPVSSKLLKERVGTALHATGTAHVPAEP